jgi:LmbE family N-acetylglucosaminyl deacetylase
VKRVRHEQSEEAARAIGARFACWDLGDYPLRIDEGTVERLADAIRWFAPDVILTHTERDPFNPDHPVAHAAVLRARLWASGAGVASAFKTVKRRSCSTSSRTSRNFAASNRTRPWISPASLSAIAELKEIGLPIWARFVRVRGTSKTDPGRLDVPVVVGGATIRPGDVVVMDDDGAVVVPAERVEDVAEGARAREDKESRLRPKLRAGELTYDLLGLRAKRGDGG